MIDYYDYLDDEEQACRCQINLSLIEEAPQAEREWLLWLFVKAPELEAESFVLFLQDLQESLRPLDAVYAGSIAKEGWIEIYFYGAVSKRFENITTEVMSRHGGFAYERGISRDGKWEMYLDRLYPDSYLLLQMQNRHTLESLLEAGDDLSILRDIEHYLFFQTRSALDRAVNSLQAYSLEVKEYVDNDEEDYAYGVVLSQHASVLPEQIEEITAFCYDAALNEHGRYEGWSTILGEDDHGIEQA